MSVIDDYISKFEGEVKECLIAIRNTIKAAAPEATEKIAYGMPCFWQGENLVYFAATKKHIGFYPTASGTEAFEEKLKKYDYSKGTVRFPHGQEIPLELIEEITKFRVRQAKAK